MRESESKPFGESEREKERERERERDAKDTPRYLSVEMCVGAKPETRARIWGDATQ